MGETIAIHHLHIFSVCAHCVSASGGMDGISKSAIFIFFLCFFYPDTSDRLYRRENVKPIRNDVGCKRDVNPRCPNH